MGKTSLNAPALFLTAAATLTVLAASPALAGFQWTPPMQVQAPEVNVPGPDASMAMPGPSAPAAQPVMPVDQMPLPSLTPPGGAPAPLVATVPAAPQPRINPYASAAPGPFDAVRQMPQQPIPPQAYNAPAPVSAGQAYGDQQVLFHGKPLRREKPTMAMPAVPQPRMVPQAPAAYQPMAPAAPQAPAVAPQVGGTPVIDLFPLMKGEQPRQPAAALFAPQNPYAAPRATLPAPGSVPNVSMAPAERSSIAAPVTSGAMNSVPFFKEAVGFGTDIPLALAVGQIVPPEYPYAFSENIDPGVRIDWNGGKPWNVVLQEAVAPHGLGVIVSENGVMIVPATSLTPTRQAAAYAPQPPQAPQQQTHYQFQGAAPNYGAPSYAAQTAPQYDEPMTPIPLTSGGWGG